MIKRTIIIPDVHNRIDRVDKILNHEQPDKVIFLGDWFDNFGDSHIDATRVAQWLKNNLHNSKYTFLWGNHDHSYAYNNFNARCSGWSGGKAEAINKILIESDWDKFEWFFWLEKDTLITHAGLSLGMAKSKLKVEPTLELVKELLDSEKSSATHDLKRDGSTIVDHWFYRAGRSRGGLQPYGGLTWNDYERDFDPIPGVKQIFGHTPEKEIRWNDDNVCLDTHLNHYLIITNTWEIKEYADIPGAFSKKI